MSGGDIVYIRAGTYNEGMLHGYGGFVFKNGKSKSSMTRFAAYSGEERKVIVKPPRYSMTTDGGGATSVVWFSDETEYVEISGIVLDGTNGGYTEDSSARAVVMFYGSDVTGKWAKNNRLINNEIRYGGGIYGGGGNEIIGNWVHHSEVYGLYTKHPDGLFEGNLVEDCYGQAMQNFQQHHEVNGWVYRNNIFRRNGDNYYPDTKDRNGSKSPRPAVVLNRGTSQFYNNIVYDNPNGGIVIGLGAVDVLVANNTVYGNGEHGIKIQPFIPGVNAGSKNARVINNIFYDNGGNQIQDQGINTTIQNNLTTDPKFVNPAAGDFGVQAGSPAIDKGMTLAEVKTDFTGKARPEGAAYDIGAFEGAGSKANVLPGMAGGLPAGVGSGSGGGGLGSCYK